MDIESVSQSINDLKEKAETFFSSAASACENIDISWRDRRESPNFYWDSLSQETKNLSQLSQEKALNVISLVIPVLKSSTLLNESDERDIGICAKQMRAALKLRNFRSWDTEVLHDEGTVLGVKAPGQSDHEPNAPSYARKDFFQCVEQLEGIVQLLKITPSHIPNGLPSKNPNLPQSYRPNTAFIMMPINPKDPELDDIYETYKESFKKFGIEAIRANEIEHEDMITKRIIKEIKTSEFLVGDLTHERPSVYYEIGYAHSLGRMVIMYRKKNTSIHFDLAAYNCPEYKNMKELKELLIKRLEEATNRKPEND